MIITRQKVKSLALWLVIGVLGVFSIVFAVKAVSALRGLVIENCNDCQFVVEGGSEDMAGMLGGGTRYPNGLSADGTSPSAGEVRGTTLTSTGAATLASATVTGDLTLTGDLISAQPYEAVTATNTIAISESGKTFYLSGSWQEHTLPATSTPGQVYRFVVSGAITASTTIVTAGGVDSISGTLLVAGAVVDCDLEDKIEFVDNLENVGDYVELYTDGTLWFIGDSGGLTGSGMTCTAS